MVRIIKKRFWKNYESHEEILLKCFKHLYYRKFPNYYHQQDFHTVEESFHDLLLEFNRLRIFERFEPSRCTTKNTEQKKLEQYIYKRVESFLYREYHERKNRTKRFRRVVNIEVFHKDMSNKKDRFVDLLSDNVAVDTSNLPTKEKKAIIKTQENAHRLYRKYPSIDDIPSLTSEKYETPADSIEVSETWKMILSICKTDLENKVVLLKNDGLSNIDVAKAIKHTETGVSSILSKLKQRYHKRAESTLIAA